MCRGLPRAVRRWRTELAESLSPSQSLPWFECGERPADEVSRAQRTESREEKQEDSRGHESGHPILAPSFVLNGASHSSIVALAIVHTLVHLRASGLAMGKGQKIPVAESCPRSCAAHMRSAAGIICSRSTAIRCFGACASRSDVFDIRGRARECSEVPAQGRRYRHSKVQTRVKITSLFYNNTNLHIKAGSEIPREAESELGHMGSTQSSSRILSVRDRFDVSKEPN